MKQAHFDCPSCGQKLTADAHALRRRMRCARCDAEFRPLDVLPADRPLPALTVHEGSEPIALPVPASPTDAADAGPPPADSPAVAPDRSTHAVAPAATRAAAASAARSVGARQWPRALAAGRAKLLRLRAIAATHIDRVIRRFGAARVLMALGALVAVTCLTIGLVAVVKGKGAQVPATAPGSAAASGTIAATAASTDPSQSHGAPPLGSAPTLSPTEAPPPSSAAAPSPTGAADRDLRRDGSDTVADGVLYVPKSFHSQDGAFDLLMHFNGQPSIVARGAEAAGLNALVFVANLGRGSKRHHNPRDPALLATILEQVRAEAEKRGLEHAQLRRLALGAFGSGGNLLAGILSSKRNVERIDALYVLEGLQVRWANKTRDRVDPNELSPFLTFARLASQGQKLFVITHSHFGGDQKFASSGVATDALLEAVGVPRTPTSESPPPVEIEGTAKLFPDGAVPHLEAESKADAQGLHVLGYGNSDPGHQLAHLVQLSVTVFPLLAERWSKSAP